MKFKQFGSRFVLRLDKGEEIIETLKHFCSETGITSGSVTGIGAVNKAILGLFEVDRKEFISREFNGMYELTGLSGNVSTMKGDAYLHLHATIADCSCSSFGGHLSSAVVSATCEIIIESIDGTIGRVKDEKIGLNIFDI